MRSRKPLIMAMHRMFRDRVVCIYVQVEEPGYHVLYQRGDRLPLFQLSSSLVLLAHLPTRRLKELYAQHAEEAAREGFARSWEDMAARLRAIRRQGFATTLDEFRRISVPVHDADGTVLASLSAGLPIGAAPQEIDSELEVVKAMASHATELLAALEDAEIARAPAPRGRRSA
jgi:DNA-binding IclR family transcriptional regulator